MPAKTILQIPDVLTIGEHMMVPGSDVLVVARRDYNEYHELRVTRLYYKLPEDYDATNLQNYVLLDLMLDCDGDKCERWYAVPDEVRGFLINNLNPE